MKTKILITALLSLSAAGAACSSQSPAANDNSHSGIDHGKMSSNSANQANMNHSGMNHGNMNHENMNHADMKSSPNAAGAPFDLQFLDTMIAHHQGAIEMAKMAESKAERAELKTLSKNIIAAQEKEIAQMKSWREKSFGGKEPAVNMEMSGMSDSMKGMDMKKLESLSGKAFDVEFIDQMIPHHEGAVVMAEEALRKSQDEQIKNLAKIVIKDQQAEVRQMTEWKRSWNN